MRRRPPAFDSELPSRSAAPRSIRARHVRAGLAPHQVGEPARQLALVAARKGAVEHVRDREPEHVVAEKFEPLIAAAASLLRRRGRHMGQRALEDRLVGKRVADLAFELVAGFRLPAHRTIENNRFQRTTQGQRQIFQAASPSPTEKKMISARPTILSIGT